MSCVLGLSRGGRFIGRRGIESGRHAVLAFVHGKLVLGADTDAHGHIALHLPVVLHKKGIEEAVVLEGDDDVF